MSEIMIVIIATILVTQFINCILLWVLEPSNRDEDYYPILTSRIFVLPIRVIIAYILRPLTLTYYQVKYTRCDFYHNDCLIEYYYLTKRQIEKYNQDKKYEHYIEVRKDWKFKHCWYMSYYLLNESTMIRLGVEFHNKFLKKRGE